MHHPEQESAPSILIDVEDTVITPPLEVVYRAFMESACRCALIDANHTITVANPAMEDVFGTSIINYPCYQMLQQRSTPCDWCPGVVVPSSFHSRHIPTWSPVQCVAQLHPESGELTGFACHHWGQAARARVEEQLERERAYLTSAIDLLPIPMLFVSANAPTARMNRAMREFLCPNLRLQDVQLLDPDTRRVIPQHERPDIRALRGEIIAFFETIVALPDARQVPVIGHAAPIFVNDEQVAVVMAFQDISALKEVDRAKDQFLAVLSHELLTPLTSILGWAQTAREQQDAELMTQALAVIERNAQRQRRIVDDLLDMSRIIHGKLSLKMERADLRYVTMQTMESVEHFARTRGVALTMELGTEVMPLFVDVARIQQVIGNLIQNGVKFTEPGGHVHIDCRVLEERACITVSDTGRGIDAEQLYLLFRPFCQIERREDSGGLGLGLALAKGIIELHGGQISAESDGPGQGSSFTITIPLFTQ